MNMLITKVETAVMVVVRRVMKVSAVFKEAVVRDIVIVVLVWNYSDRGEKTRIRAMVVVVVVVMVVVEQW